MHEMFGIFLISGLFGLLFAVIALVIFVFWIWMLIHAITNKELGGSEKLAWVLVVFFLYGLGALIYFLIKFRKGT
jgi:uncharacterized RDD family membrane protein YckC